MLIPIEFEQDIKDKKEVHRDSYHKWLVISTTIAGTHTPTIAAHTGISRMLSNAPLRHLQRKSKSEIGRRFKINLETY